MSSPSLKTLFGGRPRSRTHGSSVRLRVAALETRDVPTATVDLTTRGSSGVINDAIFSQADPQPTGTGKIQSFLRIQGAAAHGEVQQGYNTDARPLEFDENSSPQFTRSMPIANVPLVNIGGVLYRELLLDINQKSSQPLLSLDELRLYVGNFRDQRGYNSADGTLDGMAAVYDLDAGGDHWVLLNYRLNNGSGSGDMRLYIPNQVFVGGGPYLYLYSKFGEHYASNAGFQEWAAGLSPLLQVTASISGYRFWDRNNDRVFNPGEEVIPNQVVYLDADNDAVLDDDEVYAITNSDGFYQFNNLAAGLYHVRAMPITNTTETTDVPINVDLSLGEVKTHVDLGVIEGGGPPAT